MTAPEDILVPVDLACNDPDNGNFTGRCANITIDDVLTIEGRELRVRVFEDLGRILVGNLAVPMRVYNTWVGNWCWNQAVLELKHAVRLLTYLRGNGWRPDEAEQGVWEAWKVGDPLEEPLRKALAGEDEHEQQDALAMVNCCEVCQWELDMFGRCPFREHDDHVSAKA